MITDALILQANLLQQPVFLQYVQYLESIVSKDSTCRFYNGASFEFAKDSTGVDNQFKIYDL